MCDKGDTRLGVCSCIAYTNKHTTTDLCAFLLVGGDGGTEIKLYDMSECIIRVGSMAVNPLTPNDHYSGRTAPLTSKRYILYIYSPNIGTEYFKHGIYSPFFSLFKMQFVS